MRRVAHEEAAFAEGFGDEGDVALFEIADAAVNEFGAAAGGAFGEIVLLDKCRAITARGRFDGGAEASSAAADDEDVPRFGGVAELGDGLVARHCCAHLRAVMSFLV